MSIVETTLVFAGIPVAGVLLVTALVYGRANDRAPRYRPGGPWQFNPVWYLPHPEYPEHGEHGGATSGSHRAEPSAHPAELGAAGGQRALAGRVAEPVTASGGASGEW